MEEKSIEMLLGSLLKKSDFRLFLIKLFQENGIEADTGIPWDTLENHLGDLKPLISIHNKMLEFFPEYVKIIQEDKKTMEN